MNGVLVVDKPTGPTSHDVVAVARRALGERRIGHTGTLDPMASGVLPLACGKATRLVRFMSASDKAYRATVRFGVETDTYDAWGEVVRSHAARPSRDQVTAAVGAMLGEQMQMPPAFSAKRVEGRRAYDLARAQQPVHLAAARVVLMAVDLEAMAGDEAVVLLTCSAGFYVRSFAHELGQRLGCGACLAALRRTRSGAFTEARAVGLDVLAAPAAPPLSEFGPESPGWVRMAELLADLPTAVVGDRARLRVTHGQLLEVGQFSRVGDDSGIPSPDAPWTRLVDEHGELLAVARPGPRPGSLHPVVVLT